MPVKIPSTLPARAILEQENVFVMGEERAEHQDIRSLNVAILNLMPTKVATETQLLRLLGNSSLQVDITLLHTATYESKSTVANIAPLSPCNRREMAASCDSRSVGGILWIG